MTIDWWTLGFQTANVVILVWLLQRFFWRPVAAMIEQRRSTTEKALADAKEAGDKATAALADVAATRAGFAKEHDGILADAHAEAETARKATLDTAAKEAAAHTAATKAAMATEHDAAEAAWSERASQLALQIAGRLAGRLQGAAVDTAFLDWLLSSIRALPAPARQAASIEPGGIEAVSAGQLEPAEQDRYRSLIAEAFGAKPHLTFKTDPALIAGIELHGPHFALSNSWRADLGKILKDIKRAPDSKAADIWLAAATRTVAAATLGSRAEQIGRVEEVGDGVALVSGLPGVRLDELLRFAGGQFGFAQVLERDRIGCVLLDDVDGVSAGAAVRGTGDVVRVPVGPGLLGRVIDAIEQYGNPERCIVVAAEAAGSPGLQWSAPFAAMTMAEYFRDRGQHALIVIDDLTKHAATHREIALLTRQSPGREAYPGDVFYVHARLLERAAKLSKEKGGGSLTALPIAETDAGNLSAYIPTNLISITDGQIVLDAKLFYQGQKPAVDVGTSVSRVGGKTQAVALRDAAKTVRLEYAQFLELESFTRFGGMPDQRVQQQLTRGARIRAILDQPQHAPLRLADEVALVMAVQAGLLDALPLPAIAAFRLGRRQAIDTGAAASVHQMQAAGTLDAEGSAALSKVLKTYAAAVAAAAAPAKPT